MHVYCGRQNLVPTRPARFSSDLTVISSISVAEERVNGSEPNLPSVFGLTLQPTHVPSEKKRLTRPRSQPRQRPSLFNQVVYFIATRLQSDFEFEANLPELISRNFTLKVFLQYFHIDSRRTEHAHTYALIKARTANRGFRRCREAVYSCAFLVALVNSS